MVYEQLMSLLKEIDELKQRYNLSAADCLILRISAILEAEKTNYKEVKESIINQKNRDLTYANNK